jgi:hypothetical protein
MRSWALGLTLWACNPLPSGTASTASTVRRGCEADSECPAGLVCGLGACVGDAAPARALLLRVRPPEDQSLSAVEVQGISFDGAPILDLPSPVVLPARRALIGYARTSDESETSVSARALALPNGVLGGDGLETTAESVQTRRGPRFTLGLAPCWPDPAGACAGVFWRVRLTPDPTKYPPVDFENVSVGSAAAEEERPFVLPGGRDLPEVRGRLTRANGLPADDLLVFATDLDGRRLTTETRTDAVGRFSVRYWPAYGGREVVLRAFSDALGRPLPRFASTQRLPTSGVDVAEMSWDLRWPALDQTFVLVGRVVAQGEPLGGTRLRFETPLAAGRFTATALVGDAGRFEVTLYPGTYRLDVEPALGTPYRLARLRTDLSATTSQFEVVAQLRNPVVGRLVDPAGAGLPGARVVAELLELRSGQPELDRPDETPPTRFVETETITDGAFDLSLDPGVHRLTFNPPLATGLPPLQRRVEVPVESGITVLLGDIGLAPAVVLTATVRGPDEAPVPGATVEALWAPEGLEGQAERAAEGVTDTDGAVVLRLSSRP